MNINSIIFSVASEFNEDQPPYDAPNGFVWKKDPDVYDEKSDIVWEGNWNTVPIVSPVVGKKSGEKCEWGCSNAHMDTHYCYERFGGFSKCKDELVKNEREMIAKTFNPNYHVCDHTTHEECTNSPCCNCFWHEGVCYFESDDYGESGMTHA